MTAPNTLPVDVEQFIQAAAKCDSLTSLADARALLNDLQHQGQIAAVHRRKLAGDTQRADLGSSEDARTHDDAAAEAERMVRRLGAAETRVANRIRELELGERQEKLRALEARADAIVLKYRAARAKRSDLLEAVAQLDTTMRELLIEIDPVRAGLAQLGEASILAALDERLHGRAA